MVRAELFGHHRHETIHGRGVHIWSRNGKFLARGRHAGQRFGQVLGDNPKDAGAALRRLLVEIEDDTYRPPSEARKQPLKTGAVPP